MNNSVIAVARLPPRKGDSNVKKGKRSRKYGRVFFALPIIAVVILVFYSLALPAPKNGVLIIKTDTVNAAGTTTEVSLSLTLNGNTVLSPYNESLPLGTYTVTFPPLNWYHTPDSHTLGLEGGKTAYAVGIYKPVDYTIGVSADGFNRTTAVALHGVTTINWVNTGTGPVVVYISGVGTLSLDPGQAFPVVFKSSGAYSYYIPSTDYRGKVTVS